jgi:hypothetical protein
VPRARVKAAGIPYDVSNVETRSGEHAKPDIYTVEIVEAEQRTEKNDGSPANDIRIRLDFVDDDYMPLFTYIGLSGASAWKMKELVSAVGMPDKGTLQPDKLIGKKVRVKVVADQYEGNYVGRAGTLMPLSGGDGASDEEGEEEDYEEWTLDELQAEADERGLTIKGRKTEAKYREALIESDQEGGEEEAEAEEEAEPEYTDDYEEWEVPELKEELEDRKLDLPKGRLSKAKLVAVLREDDGKDPFEEE